jgi:ABC-type multidrug transport system fused ATPase/permease subunit
MKMSLRDGLKLSLSLLTKRDQKLLFLAFLVQISLSVLDLIGIGAIAAVVAIAVSVIQGSPTPDSISRFVDFLGGNDLSSYKIVVVLSISAVVLFCCKTILTALITRRQLKFLANRDAAVSTTLMSKLINQSILVIQERPTQETINGLTVGVSAAITQFLGTLLIVSSELSLLVIVGVALIFVNPLVSLGAIFLFGLAGLVLNKALGNTAQQLGKESSELFVSQANAIATTVSSFRELTVMNREKFFQERFAEARWRGAQLNAKSLFLGQISRYVFELTLVLGGFALAATQFFYNDALVAVTTLSLFLAAGTRLMPSMLRLQTGLISMRGALGASRFMVDLNLRLNTQLSSASSKPSISENSIRVNERESRSIEIINLGFKYPDQNSFAIRRLNLSVPSGTSLGIIGKSGAGKSTLVDLILGVLDPMEGEIKIGSASPKDQRLNEPGVIGYVPQEISLIQGSLEENIALGLKETEYETSWIWEALEVAQLADFVKSLPNGLKTEVGERGVKLSGGQRQRVGLARAILSRPSVLILDEATSSLDVETEFEITDAISKLPHNVTKIVIAHRLATIQNLDLICILEDGKISQHGSFDKLRKLENILANQVDLLGNN